MSGDAGAGARQRFLEHNEPAVNARALFAIVSTTSIAAVYFTLGVVTKFALGLAPLVFFAVGMFFALTAMTYVEGAALFRERGGSASFARHAFNELLSFATGWAVILDYVILLAIMALTVSSYLGTFWEPLASGWPEIGVAAAVIGWVTATNALGLTVHRLRLRIRVAFADLALQALVIVVGLVLLLDPGATIDQISLGSAPTWSNLVYALAIALIAFTGLEAAASMSGEARGVTARHLRRLVGPGAIVVVAIYVGISIVGVSALPIADGGAHLTETDVRAPLIGIAEAFSRDWLATALKYVLAAGAALALIAAANSAMLALSRLGYSMATNRHVPSAVGRLDARRGTPVVIIGLAAAAALGLAIAFDTDALVGIYAFGATFAFAIAHLSVIVLRYRAPDRERAYRIPLSLRIGRGSVPLPALAGALLSIAGWFSVLVLHAGARWLGLAWMAAGLTLYAVYRKVAEKPLLARVTIPESALRHEEREAEYGSILVPVFGREIDDDIVQTAGRLAGDERDEGDEQGATIEAIWVLAVPLALPLDARLPEAQVLRAREALARAKAVGEEYEGVEVATAMVRARRVGEGIVREAKRRGVEVIVLAAEEPSRVGGGALLGGLGGGREDNFVGDVTRYVVRRAGCRVILTAPGAGSERSAAPSG